MRTLIPPQEQKSSLGILLWIIRGKTVAHLLSNIFFFGLLVALAVIVEVTLKAHWAAVVSALRAVPPAAPAPARRAAAAAPRGRAAA